jgi:hypothetical protein
MEAIGAVDVKWSDMSIAAPFVFCFHTRTSVFCGIDSLKELRSWIAVGPR